MFDDILQRVRQAVELESEFLAHAGEMLVNRDVFGRVTLVFSTTFEALLEADEALQDKFSSFVSRLSEQLHPHAWPAERMVVFENDLQAVVTTAPSVFELNTDTACTVRVIDRLATSANWSDIADISQAPPRVVFFSIKGGVGRSSALAATAWHLAEQGKRVLILDLDLESPGLSTAILPSDKQPAYGVTDWLVEDLVDNGAAVLGSMVATSDLSREGEIYVVPAHGAEPGDYVTKLGRVWMPKLNQGKKEGWATRLERLLGELEQRLKPDVVLIDSRSGIDDIASSTITHLGARLILLFAIEGSQSWNGYKMIFDYWLSRGLIKDVRERLQLVAALVPGKDKADYLKAVQESAYELFASTQYDEVPAGRVNEYWHFESADIAGPHYPWAVHWNPSFSGLNTLHGRLVEIDSLAVQSIFGDLIFGVEQLVIADDDNN